MICLHITAAAASIRSGGMSIALRGCLAAVVGPCLVCSCLIGTWGMPQARADGDLLWQVELTDGRTRAGILRGIDDDGILVESLGDGADAATALEAAERLATPSVRIIRRRVAENAAMQGRLVDDADEAEADGADADGEEAVPGGPLAHVWMEDGSVLAAGDVVLEEDQLWLVRPAGRIAVLASSVSRLAWAAPGEAPPERPGLPPDPVWQSGIPAAAEGDLIVIRKAADPQPTYQFVPCAILGIDGEHVTVALDDDRIPVKRERVAGLVWLRGSADPQRESPTGPVVDIRGGRLLTSGVRLAPESDALTVVTAWSEGVSIPLEEVLRIDLAAGRTVSLVELAAEEVRVEPFFEGLSSIERLSRMFEPRVLPLPDGRPAMLLAPRTRMEWKLPAGVRRLRLSAQVERPEAGGGELVITVDGREVHRQAVVESAMVGGFADDAAASSGIDIELAGSRRLELLVDFPEASGGRLLGLGRVRIVDPRLEK